MKKLLLILGLALFALTSCKEETCDVSFCNMTFNFTVDGDMEGSLTTRKIQVFLKDETTERITGPINFDREEILAATNGMAAENGKYHFSITKRVPRGSFLMWVWGNIGDESVYSFDRFSISMKDNVAGDDYMLCPAAGKTIAGRNMEMDVVLKRVVGRVDIGITGSDYIVRTLYISGLARKLSANLEYSNEGTLGFEADRFENMPPQAVFLFSSMSGEALGEDADPSQFSLTYGKDGSDHSLSEELKVTAGSEQTVTFAIQQIN